MNSIASVILTAVIVLGTNLPAVQTEEVAGIWLPEPPRGSRSRWFEFRADGTVRTGFGTVVESTYRLQGTSLSVMPKGTTVVRPPKQMQIDGDTAVREQPPPPAVPPRNTLPADQRAMLDRLSQPLTMTRVGKPMPGVPLIVGTWKYTHVTGTTAYERFTSDGEMVTLVEMQGHEGTYVVRPDRVDVALPSGSHTLTRVGEALVAASSNGQAVTLRRDPR
jgi:hypothetical protein